MIAPILITLAIVFLVLAWVSVVTFKVGIILAIACILILLIFATPAVRARLPR